MPNYLSRPLTPVAGPTAVPNNYVPNLPSNTYQLLSGLADAFDRVNKKLNTHADQLHTIKKSTKNAVGEVISTSKGQVTDTLSDVWNNSTTDLNTAHDQLSTITTYQGGLGQATDFRNTLDASKTTIQNGLIAQENLQNQQSGRAAPASPEQLAQWKQDIQALDNTINNINMVIEAMTMSIYNLNSGFSYSCATGFVPGGPLPNFPKNSFAHQMSDGSSGSGNDPITRIENSVTTAGGNEADAMSLILNAEGAGVDLNVIADLLDKGISADTINSSMGDISHLLDKGVTSDTISQLLNKGVDLKLVQEALDSGVKMTPGNVLGITRDVNGRIDWLESGRGDAGLQHVLDHAKEFEQLGISKEDIPDTLLNILHTEEPIGYLPGKKGGTRDVYTIDVNGTTKYVGITVGSNGFIVGAQTYGSKPPAKMIPYP